MGGDRRIGVFWAWGRGGSAYRRIGVFWMDLGVSAYSGPGGSGGISVSAYRYSGSGVGGGGDWRIGVVPFSGHASGASAYRRILGLGVGGGRGVGVSAYRRIIVFGAASGASAYRRILGLGGGGGGDRRIGVSAYYRFWGRAAHRRIGVFWAWGSGGLGGGSAYRRMGVFWAWGVGGGWIGVSAYRRVGAAHRRIGVFWAWRGVREEIGVSAYSGPEGSVGGGGDRRNGVSAYVGFLPLFACTLAQMRSILKVTNSGCSAIPSSECLGIPAIASLLVLRCVPSRPWPRSQATGLTSTCRLFRLPTNDLPRSWIEVARTLHLQGSMHASLHIVYALDWCERTYYF